MARSSKVGQGILWEVLAPVIRWPLHSPARLALVVLALLAAVVGLGRLNGGEEAPPAAAVASSAAQDEATTDTSTSPAQTSSTAASSSSGSPSSTAAASASSAAATAPASAARQFVAAWARPELPAQTWLAGVTPLATTGFATSLQSVDPANVPGTRVAGAPVVRAQTPTTATVEVATDRAVVAVSLVPIAGQWKVSALTPVRSIQQTPGAGSSLRATYTPLPTTGG